jgi:ubiquinone/menaquinone biosynthesis C-methylase UbiE
MDHPGFDDLAATWDDDPEKIARARAVARAIVDHIDLSGAQVIEDGAGTGLLGFALLEMSEPATLTFIDPSAGMRAQVAQKIRRLTPGQARVLSPEDEPGHGRDLVMSLMMLHHVPDPPAKFQQWSTWLAKGGHVAVADLYPEDGSFHGTDVEHVHHGFDPALVTRWMQEAGLEVLASSTSHTIHKSVDGTERRYPVWLLIGRKR